MADLPVPPHPGTGPRAASSAPAGEPMTPPVGLAGLLGERGLGLRHLAGPAVAEVHGVHASEMADPSPYLLGGELLLTAGAGLGDADAGAYVARLVRAGVAGLGFGVTPVHETVPAGLAEACAEYGLPLVEVPPGTPFTAVARTVWRLMAEARTRELRRVTEAQQSLAAAAARPDPVPSVLSRLAATLGGWAALWEPDAAGSAEGERPGPTGPGSGPAGAAVGTAPAPGPADRRRGTGAGPGAGANTAAGAGAAGGAGVGPELAGRQAGAGTGAAAGAGAAGGAGVGPGSTADGGAPATAFRPARAAAGPEPGEQVRAALAALARRVVLGSAATATDSLGGTQLAAYAVGGGRVLALATPGRAAGDHTIASVGAVLLTLLTASGPAGAEAAALARLLLDGDPAAALTPGPWYAVHARGGGDPRALAAALGTVLLDPRGDGVRLITDREPGPQPGWRLGVSAPAAPAELRTADAQARRALARAEASRTPLARHTDPGVTGLVGAAEARGHAEALLRPLSPALRETLRAWLSHHGSWDRTAAALGVHRNTVRQRIARCTALLGDADLDDTDTRMELWFALRWLGPAPDRPSGPPG
ncbi:purine catabolism regulatory family protein [Streptomyces sp. Ag109_G2-6]|uniref:PucR family transcriptional regulator n=1 Tax=Streptomyces sp. Ag109_G2-6 TaxID=2485154 RepID=UPI000FA0024A|nr:PucR family transcriptional regulator [Streptomyces sp. Ag109_G2-6]RPF40678.1 purine catabolism regulatory family protein [Streptomyces sp. Ag109_G2-6]